MNAFVSILATRRYDVHLDYAHIVEDGITLQ